MSPEVRIALLGCGGMGLRHLRAYEALYSAPNSGLKLVAIGDRDPERREEAIRSFREATGREAQAFASLEELAASGIEVDAVDITLPTWLHHTIAVEAFRLGWHVMVQKPLALTVRAARAIEAAASEAGKVFAVSENFRRMPGNRAFKALLEDGRLGEIFWNSSDMVLPRSAIQGGARWYFEKLRSGGLVSLEMGVHEADLLSYWFGPIESVNAEVRIFERTYETADGETAEVTSDDACFARLTHASGITSQILLTMSGHGVTFGRRHVVGSQGSLNSTEWELWQGGRLVLDGGEEQGFDEWTANYMSGLGEGERDRYFPEGSYDPGDLSLDIRNPLRYGVAMAIWDFARACRGEGAPEVGFEEGFEALSIGLACVESSLSGQAVRPADVRQGLIRDWQAEIDDELELG